MHFVEGNYWWLWLAQAVRRFTRVSAGFERFWPIFVAWQYSGVGQRIPLNFQCERIVGPTFSLHKNPYGIINNTQSSHGISAKIWCGKHVNRRGLWVIYPPLSSDLPRDAGSMVDLHPVIRKKIGTGGASQVPWLLADICWSSHR